MAKEPIKKQIKVKGKLFIKAPIFLISCSSLNECIIEPALKNDKALKKA